VGTTAGLDVVKKRKITCHHRDSNPGTSSPQCSRDPDYATPVPEVTSNLTIIKLTNKLLFSEVVFRMC
jgi:hypothetical protein